MNIKHWIRQLRSSPHLSEQLRAVRHLKAEQHLPEVSTAMSLTAVDTQRQPLRVALMAALKDNAQAEAYFLGVARGEGPVYLRKWAFLNLSLMGSQRAREVVLAGLQDSRESIRRAASSHVALYTDEAAQRAFVNYFEANRSIYLRDCLAQLGTPLRQLYREISALKAAPGPAPLEPFGRADG